MAQPCHINGISFPHPSPGQGFRFGLSTPLLTALTVLTGTSEPAPVLKSPVSGRLADATPLLTGAGRAACSPVSAVSNAGGGLLTGPSRVSLAPAPFSALSVSRLVGLAVT